MKLLKALYWYYFKYKPEPRYSYSNFQIEKMGALTIVALLVLSYFFVEGLVTSRVNQVWGCGIGLLLVLFFAFILSMILLGRYNEHLNDKNN